MTRLYVVKFVTSSPAWTGTVWASEEPGPGIRLGRYFDA